MRIGKTEIGKGRAYIIADVGSNFDGSLSLAKEYIAAAKEIEADAIKFQTYKAETLVHPFKPDGERWQAYDTVKRYELPLAWHGELFEYAESLGVEFLTTPFDLDVLGELDRMGMRAFKIASGDLTFTLLLEKIAGFGKPVILSTGMAELDEIQLAVDTLQRAGAGEIALLHCVANYPPRFEQVNLRAITTMLSHFRMPVGLSDHTRGNVTALGAIALGASVIEKHITTDRQMGPPDAPFAMSVEEFGQMISDIRDLERALGDGRKQPAPDEESERTWSRRGIYARADLERGRKLDVGDVKFVRPANGISAADWPFFAGKRLKDSVAVGLPLRKEMV